MIPEKLELSGFGPYRTPQTIDFTALKQAGLFLIRGKTGSGKTAIFDALTYALYGKSSGGMRGDFASQRCQFCTPEEPTYVRLHFTAEGKRYVFERRLRIRRKRSGQVEYVTEQDASCQTIQGDFVPLFENPRQRTVDALAEQITGLTCEQFRQVAMLPQGQFERLLVADSAEKEKLLTTLFGTAHWDAAAKKYGEQVRQQKMKVDTLKQQLEVVLAQYQVETIAQLQQKEEQSIQRLQAAQQAYTVLTQHSQQAEEKLAEAQLLAQEFARLTQAQAALTQLDKQADAIAEKQRIFALQELAQLLNRYAQHTEQLAQAEKQMQRAEEKLSAQEQLAQQLIQQIQESEALQERQTAALQALPQARAQEEKHAAQAELAQQITQQAEQISQFTLQCTSLKQAYQAKLLEHRTATDMHLQWLSAELATQLQEGTPCPVCGSMHHPEPAQPALQTVTRDQLSRLSEQLQQANAQLNKQEAMLQAAVTQQQTLLAKQTQIGSYEPSAHQAARQQRQALEQTAKALEQTAQQLKHARQMQKQQAQDKIAAQAMLEKCRIQCEALQAACQAAQDAVTQKDADGQGQAYLKAHDIHAEAFVTLEQEITQYNTKRLRAQAILIQQQEKLAGTQPPQLTALQQHAQQLASQRLAANAALAVQEKELHTLQQDNKKAQQLTEKYQTLRAEYDKEAVFVNLLLNPNGVSLQRYVLGVMLTAVTAQANELLQRVHDGRYQISRTLETTGGVRRAGLELNVIDRLSGGQRPAASLSGGEKFLAALALAIGLSTVVQAQSGGKRLGALFIDEGFGTLDAASVGDALCVLSAVRAAHGMVGIISHEELLLQSIEAGITVQKTSTGSIATCII